jgi:hypothetical protein
MRVRGLYAVVLLAAGAALALEMGTASPVLRTVIDVAEVVVVFGAMALWVRANRGALAEADRPPSEDVRWEERA